MDPATPNPEPLPASTPRRAPKRFGFSLFEADLECRELRRRGLRVPLADKPFEILVALLERPGELVTRQDLQERLWHGDTFVDFDNNLNASVRRVRQVLGDSATSPRFIETLPKRGYRFIGEVHEIAEPRRAGPPRRASPVAAEKIRQGTDRIEIPETDLDRDASPRPGDHTPSEGLGSSLKLLGFLAAAGLVLTLILLASFSGSFRGLGFGDSGGGSRARADAGPERVRLAVLPLADFASPDEDRGYFIDGLAEELITQLGRLQPERLGVIARMSSMHYRETEKSARQIGQELDVDYLIQGSIVAIGREMRISIHLVRTHDETHLWAESYDASLENLMRLQGDVAISVAQALTLELLPEEPLVRARAGTRSTAAYEAYLRGRHAWHRFTAQGYDEAIASFDKALAADPSFAAAWAGLANAHNLRAFTAKASPAEAFSQAREAATRALDLDPYLASAHGALAFVLLYHDYDLESADAAFKRAVELAPNDAMTYHWWGGALSALGRHDEAIAAVQHALDLDPASLSVRSDLGWYYLFADRFEEGRRLCLDALEDGRYGWAEGCVFEALVSAGDLDAATRWEPFREDLRPGELHESPAETLLAHARENYREGRERTEFAQRYPLELALAATAAELPDEAFSWLEKAYELRQPWLVFLRVDPRFDPLHADARFEELSERLGLPAI